MQVFHRLSETLPEALDLPFFSDGVDHENLRLAVRLQIGDHSIQNPAMIRTGVEIVAAFYQTHPFVVRAKRSDDGTGFERPAAEPLNEDVRHCRLP